MNRVALGVWTFVACVAGAAGCREVCNEMETRYGDKCVLRPDRDAAIDGSQGDPGIVADGGEPTDEDMPEASTPSAEQGLDGGSLESGDPKLGDAAGAADDAAATESAPSATPGGACLTDACTSGRCLMAEGRCQCNDGFSGDGGATCVPDVASIAVGAFHTCARKGDGILCWGANTDGRLGNGGTLDSSFPVAVAGITSAAEVSAGAVHSCSRTESGVFCWGRNRYGGLGNGTTLDSPLPVPVHDLAADVEQVSVGIEFSCALRAGGTVACWGANDFGQLGSGTESNSTRPVSVLNVNDIAEISVGGRHACGRQVGGLVVCWGDNSSGQLATGNFATVKGGLPVRNVTDAVEISSGAFHTCARTSTGGVVCWGSNEYGQLGNGTLVDASVLPVAVIGLHDAVELAAGGWASCARRATGSVVCWGGNGSGQLGNGKTVDATTPVSVAGLPDAIEIGVGGAHACARRMGGSVVCWGANTYGALGNGTLTNSSSPVIVMGL